MVIYFFRRFRLPLCFWLIPNSLVQIVSICFCRWDSPSLPWTIFSIAQIRSYELLLVMFPKAPRKIFEGEVRIFTVLNSTGSFIIFPFLRIIRGFFVGSSRFLTVGGLARQGGNKPFQVLFKPLGVRYTSSPLNDEGRGCIRFNISCKVFFGFLSRKVPNPTLTRRWKK